MADFPIQRVRSIFQRHAMIIPNGVGYLASTIAWINMDFSGLLGQVFWYNTLVCFHLFLVTWDVLKENNIYIYTYFYLCLINSTSSGLMSIFKGIKFILFHVP